MHAAYRFANPIPFLSLYKIHKLSDNTTVATQIIHLTAFTRCLKMIFCLISRLMIFDMDFDRARSAICRSLKCLVCFLKLISVCHKRLQVDDFML